MPTHDRPDVIGFAVASVLKQDMPDFELLIVGDGCSPETIDVVESIRDDRIRFLHYPKAPAFGYANRNRAMREARGDLIAYCADDDLLFSDHISLLIKHMPEACRLVYAKALWVSTDGIVAPLLTNLENRDELAYFMTVANSLPAPCFMYRRSAVPQIDSWPEDVNIAADWRLWQRIIERNGAHAVRYCRTPTVLHFSARRTESRYSKMPQFLRLLEIADRADWYPKSLKIAAAANEPEQKVFFELMADASLGWQRSARSAAEDVTARIAWDNINASARNPLRRIIRYINRLIYSS